MLPGVDGVRTLELGFAGEQRDRLNQCVLYGSERATAGVAVEYEKQAEAVEHVGKLLVLLGNHGEAVVRVRRTDVVVRRSDDVPWKCAESGRLPVLRPARDVAGWRGRRRPQVGPARRSVFSRVIAVRRDGDPGAGA